MLASGHCPLPVPCRARLQRLKNEGGAEQAPPTAFAWVPALPVKRPGEADQV